MNELSNDPNIKKNTNKKGDNNKMNMTVTKAFFLVFTLLCLIIGITFFTNYTRTTVTNSTSNPPVIPTSYIQEAPSNHTTLVA